MVFIGGCNVSSVTALGQLLYVGISVDVLYTVYRMGWEPVFGKFIQRQPAPTRGSLRGNFAHLGETKDEGNLRSLLPASAPTSASSLCCCS